MTVGLAVLVFFVLPRDTNSRWFTPEERRVAELRLLKESTHEGVGKISWKAGLAVFGNWHVWAFAAMAFLCGVGVASSSNFLPVCIYYKPFWWGCII
jgi:hypothetical protein